jgi:hypothetical protein
MGLHAVVPTSNCTRWTSALWSSQVTVLDERLHDEDLNLLSALKKQVHVLIRWTPDLSQDLGLPFGLYNLGQHRRKVLLRLADEVNGLRYRIRSGKDGCTVQCRFATEQHIKELMVEAGLPVSESKKATTANLSNKTLEEIREILFEGRQQLFI